MVSDIASRRFEKDRDVARDSSEASPKAVATALLSEAGESRGQVRARLESRRNALDVRGLLLGVWTWFSELPPARFVSKSLLRLIFISNIVGLLLLGGGIFYFGDQRALLIEAKRESLKVQGEIIAAAIAARASVGRNRRIELDPGNLPDAEGTRAPFRDDAFAALEQPIEPERVTSILRKLIKPANVRARIYGRDGSLVVDTAMLLERGTLTKPTGAPAQAPLKAKTLWTRIQSWMMDGDLPVYREIDSAKGTAYPEVRMALSGSTTPMLLLTENGEQVVSMAVPIRHRQVEGVLLLSTRPGEIDDALWAERMVLLSIGAVALMATLVSSLILDRTVAGPMRRLSASAEVVSHNINARMDLPDYPRRDDEVGQLARAFRAMTNTLFRRIEASEKFAADVAHELKNPLTAARSVAESLDYAKTPEHKAQLIEQLQGELKRLNRLITDVANASRLDAELARAEMLPVNIAATATGVRDVFREILSDDARRIELEIAPLARGASLMVQGNDGRLNQVMTNLVDNALSFSPRDGMVWIKVRRDGMWVEFVVEDEGPGVPPDRLEIIFERFYTDRPQTESLRGKNSGLGLSISREIVRAHGGVISAEARKPVGLMMPSGARFVVRLPALGGYREGAASVRRT